MARMQWLAMILTFSCACLAGGADKAAPAAQKLDGIWKPIGAVLGGGRLPKEALDAITLKMNGNNYEVAVQGEKEPDQGTSTLDVTTTPKRMTIISTNGPNRGKTFLAIYEMKDDRSLRVCYDLSGTAFPKDFKAPKGTELYLVGYRRQPGKPADVPQGKSSGTK